MVTRMGPYVVGMAAATAVRKGNKSEKVFEYIAFVIMLAVMW